MNEEEAGEGVQEEALRQAMERREGRAEGWGRGEEMMHVVGQGGLYDPLPFGDSNSRTLWLGRLGPHAG